MTKYNLFFICLLITSVNIFATPTFSKEAINALLKVLEEERGSMNSEVDSQFKIQVATKKETFFYESQAYYELIKKKEDDRQYYELIEREEDDRQDLVDQEEFESGILFNGAKVNEIKLLQKKANIVLNCNKIKNKRNYKRLIKSIRKRKK